MLSLTVSPRETAEESRLKKRETTPGVERPAVFAPGVQGGRPAGPARASSPNGDPPPLMLWGEE